MMISRASKRWIMALGTLVATATLCSLRLRHAPAYRELAARDAKVPDGGSFLSPSHLVSFYYAGRVGHGRVGDEDIFTQAAEMVRESIVRLQPGKTVNVLPDLVADSTFLDASAPPATLVDLEGCLRLQPCHLEDCQCVAGAFLGGGSSLDPTHIGALLPVAAAKKPLFIFGSGYQGNASDGLSVEDSAALITDRDGVGDLVAKNGRKLPGDLLDLKYSSPVRELLTEAGKLRHSVYGGARGALSSRFLRFWASQFSNQYMYDPAILSDSYCNGPGSDAFFWKSMYPKAFASKKIVLVNYVGCGSNRCSGNGEMILDAFAQSIAGVLQDQSTSVVLYSATLEQQKDSVDLVSRLISTKNTDDFIGKAVGAGRLVTVLQDKPLSCSQFVSLHRTASLFIGNSLDAFVLSAAAGTPFVGVSPLIESLDFSHSVGQSHWVLPGSAISDPAALWNLVQKLHASGEVRSSIRMKLLGHVEQARSRYEKNMDQFLLDAGIKEIVGQCSERSQIEVKAFSLNNAGLISVYCS